MHGWPEPGTPGAGDGAATAGVAAGTGERVSVSMSHSAVEGYPAVRGCEAISGYEAMPGPPKVARPGTAMFRRRSLQPSRRAVLHVQAAGDPAVPSDLADWFTERAFHFYLAGLRLPHRLTARPGGRSLVAACADLDAACAQLRQADGIGQVIVAAQGRGALAAALWSECGRRQRAAGDCGWPAICGADAAGSVRTRTAGPAA